MQKTRRLAICLLIPLLFSFAPNTTQALALLANSCETITALAKGEPTPAGDSTTAPTTVEPSLLENTQSGLSLALGQAVVLRYNHLAAGPLNWSISLTELDPGLTLQLSILLQTAEVDEPTELLSELITARVAGGLLEQVASGDVMIMLTPKPTEESAALSSTMPVTLTLDLLVAGALEPNTDAPPTISSAYPVSGPEVWGREKNLIFDITTVPYSPVYFGTSEEAEIADAQGKVSQLMQLGDGLINTLQAFTVGTSGHLSLVTATVVKHWVLTNPAQPLVINQLAAISVAVPDASLVDLARSTMELDGAVISLRADLTRNLISALPPTALAVGTHDIKLALVSHASKTGEPGRLLDALSWQLIVPGDRLAELWPERKACSVNGIELPLEAAPYIDVASSSSMIPFRFLGDLMGAQVAWNEANQEVTFRLGEQNVRLHIGRKTAFVNELPVALLVAPSIVNSRTLVPLRFVIENLGAKVSWDPMEMKITVQVEMN